MAIHSFLKAEKGDPDWLFSPDEYFGKPFKLLDANTVELKDGKEDSIVLRLNPTEKATVHILCYEDTVDEAWVNQALQEYDKSKIKRVKKNV